MLRIQKVMRLMLFSPRSISYQQKKKTSKNKGSISAHYIIGCWIRYTSLCLCGVYPYYLSCLTDVDECKQQCMRLNANSKEKGKARASPVIEISSSSDSNHGSGALPSFIYYSYNQLMLETIRPWCRGHLLLHINKLQGWTTIISNHWSDQHLRIGLRRWAHSPK